MLVPEPKDVTAYLKYSQRNLQMAAYIFEGMACPNRILGVSEL